MSGGAGRRLDGRAGVAIRTGSARVAPLLIDRIAFNVKRRDLIEIATVGVVALIAVAASLMVAPGLRGLLGAGLALVMLAIAVIDARHFIIPDELSAAAFALALLDAATQWEGYALEGVAAALLRTALLALLFQAVRLIYRRLRRREGMGLGDVKLAGVAGAWLGWFSLPIAIELAALAALVAYVSAQFLGGRALEGRARLPFGLFLAPSIWLGWAIEAIVFAS